MRRRNVFVTHGRSHRKRHEAIFGNCMFMENRSAGSVPAEKPVARIPLQQYRISGHCSVTPIIGEKLVISTIAVRLATS